METNQMMTLNQWRDYLMPSFLATLAQYPKCGANWGLRASFAFDRLYFISPNGDWYLAAPREELDNGLYKNLFRARQLSAMIDYRDHGVAKCPGHGMPAFRTPYELRDMLLHQLATLTKQQCYMVVTKEGAIEAIIGNFRFEVMTKEEVKANDTDKAVPRMKKALGK